MIASDRSKNFIFRPLPGAALGAALLLSAGGSAGHAQSFTNIIDPANPTFTQALGINGRIRSSVTETLQILTASY